MFLRNMDAVGKKQLTVDFDRKVFCYFVTVIGSIGVSRSAHEQVCARDVIVPLVFTVQEITILQQLSLYVKQKV